MSEYDEYSYTKAALHHFGVEDKKKEKRYTKQEAIECALEKASGLYTFPRQPGYVVKHLPEEVREVLKECDEKDWNHRIK